MGALVDWKDLEHNVSVQEFLEITEHFFAGALEDIDDDLSDGAWFQMHVDIAESIIDAACEVHEVNRPDGIDGFDITHYYLAARSK